MAHPSLDVLLKGSSGRNTRGFLRIIILCTIAAAAVSSRLFSVIRMSLQVSWPFVGVQLEFLLIFK